MTTLVTILNQGPENVKLEVQSRDVRGHFVQNKEVLIEAGKFAHEYIHSTQSIQLIEVKKDAAVSTEGTT